MSKKSNISEKLVAAVAPIVGCTLDLAVEQSYPYSVYEIDESPLRDKTGVYGHSATGNLYIVDNDTARLEDITSRVEKALEELRSATFRVDIVNRELGSDDTTVWANRIQLDIIELWQNN